MTYIQPGLLFLMLVLAAALLRLPRPRARRIAWLALIGMFLWSWELTGYFLSGTLEWRYAAQNYPAQEAEAIVVLSGGAQSRGPGRPEDLPARDTYIRTSYASWLYHHWRPLPIVASGGVMPGRRLVLAEVIQRVLMEQGVPQSSIWLEPRSRSTYENALYSAEILRARGIHKIAVVTEAYHMLRAELAFRKMGFTVVPAPCEFRRLDGSIWQLVPGAKALDRNELVLHEWVGIVWYWLSRKL
jgi:uncharacterized SAM-binding protein YcdF (DUF218 family)